MKVYRLNFDGEVYLFSKDIGNEVILDKLKYLAIKRVENTEKLEVERGKELLEYIDKMKLNLKDIHDLKKMLFRYGVFKSCNNEIDLDEKFIEEVEVQD